MIIVMMIVYDELLDEYETPSKANSLTPQHNLSI